MLQGKDLDDALAGAREELRAGSGMEPPLLELRRFGADKVDSIKIVKSSMSVSVAQAKSLVDRSEAWADRYEADGALHQAVREAVERLADEDSGAEIMIEDRSVDPERR
jgi:ribosomal protein L7/L12